MTEVSDTILLRRDLRKPLPGLALPAGIVLGSIRPADARAAHSILQSAYANGFGSVHPDWLTWWETVKGDSEFDPELCIVARQSDRPVGLALCWTSSFIKDLVVAPDCQHRGIGRALLTAALAMLLARGNPEARLKVRAGNAPARRLYESFEFLA